MLASLNSMQMMDLKTEIQSKSPHAMQLYGGVKNTLECGGKRRRDTALKMLYTQIHRCFIRCCSTE
ncbi:hypothetical protein SMSP2_02017 [Limihaloglobus sulfuriphilus]|uniref:Uncharacterized protein n=1 Tax=Limihaloglobus sulfuriphilus TaxID=1851148 RepID=A0A1Q2MG36_9BACT|nr:hypothetical protein SMSP2_02017 [Limihaloglobus sulfuriphilus]